MPPLLPITRFVLAAARFPFDESARARCAGRRAAGIATVAAVAGTYLDARACVERLAIGEGRATADVRRPDEPAAYIEAFFSAIDRDGTGFPSGATRLDRAVSLDAVHARGGAFARLAEAMADSRPESLGRRLMRAGTNEPSRGVTPASLVAAGCNVFGATRSPIVIAQAPDLATLERAAVVSVEIAEGAVEADLIVISPLDSWLAFAGDAGAERTRSLLRETAYFAGPAPTAALEDPIRDAIAISAAPDADAADRARSEVERRAFAFLEANRYTHGCFELNGRLDVLFGASPMEIDLLDRRHRIAIEIDGFHHFTDSDRYRRDRKKDCLLQRQGYFVARFLADDVVREPAQFVAAVVNMLLESEIVRT